MASPAHKNETVWIVEDDEGYRLSTQELINSHKGLYCTFTFDSGEALLEALQAAYAPPDVVLMDIGLPGLSGIECVSAFRRMAPYAHDTTIIMLTIHSEYDAIFEAICAGANGYLLKAARPEEIIEAIKCGVVIDPRIARDVLGMLAHFAAPKFDYGLTGREKEVLQGIVDGKTKQQIADDLCIAFSTVDSHLRKVYQKLQVHSRSEAVRIAVEGGILGWRHRFLKGKGRWRA